MNSLCCSSHSALVTVKIKHWNIQSYNAKITVLCPLIAPPMVVFLSFDTCRSKSIKIEPQQRKSIKINNHKKVCDRLLLISDICWLISIDFYRQRLIFTDYRNYRYLISCHMARKSIHDYFNVINRTTEQHAEEAEGTEA